MYADYVYYKDTYRGNRITESEWPALSRRADSYLDTITYGRLQQGWPLTDDIRMAACALADTLYQQQTEQTAAGIKSESTGSQSVTYETDQERRRRQSAACLEAVDGYLPRWHPLRYAGAYPRGEPPC